MSTNSAKKEAIILWTCYAIRWIGKGNNVGTRRWKEEERTTKDKWMDEIHEVTGMKLPELRDATTYRKQTPPKTVLYLIVVGVNSQVGECLVGLCHQG